MQKTFNHITFLCRITGYKATNYILVFSMIFLNSKSFFFQNTSLNDHLGKGNIKILI